MELRKADANQSRLPINPDVDVKEELKHNLPVVLFLLFYSIYFIFSLCSVVSKVKHKSR